MREGRNRSKLRAASPDRVLAPAQSRELAGPERRFSFRKELVKLWRLPTTGRQHRMRPPAMVDLMLKQVHQNPVAAVGLYPRIPVDPHHAVETLRRQRIADRDQAGVN